MQINNYTQASRTTLINQGYGPSVAFLETSTDLHAPISGFLDLGECNPDAEQRFQFKPSSAEYTIEEVVEGEFENLDGSGVSLGSTSYRTEHRLFCKDPLGDIYYINGSLQGYAPTPPLAGELIKLTITPVIGYADVITKRIRNFNIYSSSKDQTQATQIYNDWVAL